MSSGINEKKVPIENKTVLTVQECAALTGIGQNTLEYALSEKDCPFALIVGRKKMIIRKAFDDYLLENRELITPSPKKGDKDRFDLNVDDINGKYKVFPDRCAHSNEHVYSILGHVVLDGLDDEDIIEGNACSDFFEKMGVDKESQIFYSPYDIKYDKSSGCVTTLAEHIARNWYLPREERKKPFGAYVINDAPSHNVVIDESSGPYIGTIISPLIDCWSRESNAPHIIIPDREGSLLLQHADHLRDRGFNVKVIDAINGNGNCGFNPFKPAIQAAIEGKMVKVAICVESIVSVLFKSKEGLDAEFYNVANANVFKLVAYSLIANALREYRKKDSEIQSHTENNAIWKNVTIPGVIEVLLQLSAQEFDWKEAYPELIDDEWAGEGSIFLFANLSIELAKNEGLEDLSSLILNARNATLACSGPARMFKAILSNTIAVLSKYNAPAAKKVLACNLSDSLCADMILDSNEPVAVFLVNTPFVNWFPSAFQMFVYELESAAFDRKMNKSTNSLNDASVRYVIPEPELLKDYPAFDTLLSISLSCDQAFTFVVNSFGAFKGYFDAMVENNTMNIIFCNTHSDGTLKTISDMTEQAETSMSNPRKLRTNDLMALDRLEVVTLSAFDNHVLRCRNDNIMPSGRFMYVDNTTVSMDYHHYGDWLMKHTHPIVNNDSTADFGEYLKQLFDSYKEKKRHTD